MRETIDYQNFLRLLDSARSNLNSDDYTDDKWCANYTIDEYFLYILCWAGWRPKRQENVWKEVRDNFNKLGKQLHTFQSVDVEKLSELYPLPWQKRWLQKLIDFLVVNSLTAQDFIFMLRKMGYENARKKLQKIVVTEEGKIVDCWLRDIVRLDAFPIDSRIRDLLEQYGIPVDSDFVIECCKKDNIPIRSFARALYDKAEILKKLSGKKHGWRVQ